MHDPLALPYVHRSTIVFDVVMAVVFGLVAGSVEWTHTSTAAGVATVLIAVAIAVRDVWPSVMIVLAVTSAILQVATTDVAVFGSLGFAPLFAITGAHPDRRVRRLSLWAGLAGAVASAIVMPLTYPNGEASWTQGVVIGFIGALLVCVGGWVWGFTRYQRRSVEQARVTETIAELERKRLVDLYDEQTERSRLARDMHDVVAHSLAVVIAQAEGARFALKSSPEDTDEALGVIADTAREALGEVRDVLQQLRDDDTAAQSTAADREQLYTRMRAAGMDLTAQEVGDAEKADPAAARVAHRVLTEALTNALKHGDPACPVSVVHDWTDGTRLTVRNTIAATPAARSTPGAGHGIVGMSERASTVGGRLSSRADGEAWVLEFVAPARDRVVSVDSEETSS
ncbi:MAG: histidine kinase [Gordonia sp. (in: high G+C Gram-positive bacteria)]|uniref:histidine kinase n=1 Tax=Gordonia sp. (in: high G+C Gram-positive bacteria) TaxID=84139 RepID=UPI0039E71EC0